MSYSDRIKGALSELVRSTAPTLDYLAMYPAKVVSQNADLTLELQPDDARIGSSVSKVPIRHGVPGMTVKVSGGARVLLSFEGGKPTNPVAALWESASVTELNLNGTVIKLNAGGTPVAKEGSVTTGHTHSATPILISSPGGGPVTGTVVIGMSTDTVATGAGSSSVKVP